MSPLKIHAVYEYGADMRPHGSSFIRLLRPLSHPALAQAITFSAGRDFDDRPVDAVIVDRLWRPDISLAQAEDLVDRIHRAGAQFIFSLDDNLLDLPMERKDWPQERHLQTVNFFLRQAAGVLVSVAPLKERLSGYNRKIEVVPNALDERLLVPRPAPVGAAAFPRRRKTIGYMGTLTHDSDLLMILPALRAVCERHRDEIEFQLIGGFGGPEARRQVEGLPITTLEPRPGESEYPLFMLWYTGQVEWDIALAPLRETPFTRSKSDIKFLDYCAIAAPGIYSRVTAYEGSVEPDQTGLLAANDPAAWEAALESLLANPDLRQEICQNAVRYLYSQRTLARRAPDWLAALERILA